MRASAAPAANLDHPVSGGGLNSSSAIDADGLRALVDAEAMTSLANPVGFVQILLRLAIPALLETGW
jgi:hypothetical protein